MQSLQLSHEASGSCWESHYGAMAYVFVRMPATMRSSKLTLHPESTHMFFRTLVIDPSLYKSSMFQENSEYVNK